MKILYEIPTPYDMGDRMIQVYGDPENGQYEWRIVAAGRVERDTKDVSYGSAEIALRDALIEASGNSECAVRQSHAVKVDDMSTARRLSQVCREMKDAGFEGALFLRIPGQAKRPVAYLLFAESIEDLKQARQSFSRMIG